MRFVDTNVLLYAVSAAPDERDKAATARDVLAATDIALSVQVLQEFYVQATHRHREDRLSDAQAAALVDSWTRFRVEEATLGLVRAAMSTSSRWGIGFSDAAVVEAARASGCAELLTEDLQDGMDFAGVRVVSPFA